MDTNVEGGCGNEPLVLLPGLICDSRIFAGQLAAFPQAMVAPSYLDLADLGRMAERVLEAAPARFALLGHSMGARVALEVVRRGADRVTRLALVSTGIHPVPPDERAKRHALRDIGRAEGMTALVDRWLPPMIGAANAGDADLYASLRAMCVESGLPAYEAQIEALLARPPVEALLPLIAVPTLLAVGDDDRWSPAARHAEIAARIPGARLRVIPAAGHMLPAEAPRAFNRAIAEWLSWPTGDRGPIASTGE